MMMMSNMGSDPMGMMSNQMAGMGGNTAPMSGMAQGYAQMPGYAGQAYGYMQAPGVAGNMVNQGANAAAHGAATGGGLFGTTGGGLTVFLTGLLNFTIAVFAILLVVSLIVGTILLLKRYLLDGNGTTVTAASLGLAKRRCAQCGTALNQNFSFCPACGERKSATHGELVTT